MPNKITMEVTKTDDGSYLEKTVEKVKKEMELRNRKEVEKIRKEMEEMSLQKEEEIEGKDIDKRF